MYTIWDPNAGTSTPLSIALAATLASMTTIGLVAPTVTGGMTVAGGITAAAVPGSGVSAAFQTVTLGGVTATQVATLSGGASIPPTGTVVANGATPVTVADANVTANSTIILTLKTAGGTVSVNPPSIHTISPGTGFTIQANASDTSTYNYLRIG